MYEVSHTPDIVQFQSLDLSGDAKQTSHVPYTSAPLFFHFLLVSELLYELLLLEMLYELCGEFAACFASPERSNRQN